MTVFNGSICKQIMTFCAKCVLHIKLFGFTALACEERVMSVLPISRKESLDLLFIKHGCKIIYFKNKSSF